MPINPIPPNASVWSRVSVSGTELVTRLEHHLKCSQMIHADEALRTTLSCRWFCYWRIRGILYRNGRSFVISRGEMNKP